ncbi:MAG: hypothetical protein QJR06_07865 [Alicyclobacillaceae bacterium]|nr:hypothetical protein [Alicyclobacillaceae bacterium]
MAYAIFWTIVVIAAAVALAYLFSQPAEDEGRRTAARLKNRESIDTEFGESPGAGEAGGRSGERTRAADRTESWNEGTPSGGVAGSGAAQAPRPEGQSGRPNEAEAAARAAPGERNTRPGE